MCAKCGVKIYATRRWRRYVATPRLSDPSPDLLRKRDMLADHCLPRLPVRLPNSNAIARRVGDRVGTCTLTSLFAGDDAMCDHGRCRGSGISQGVCESKHVIGSRSRAYGEPAVLSSCIPTSYPHGSSSFPQLLFNLRILILRNGERSLSGRAPPSDLSVSQGVEHDHWTRQGATLYY